MDLSRLPGQQHQPRVVVVGGGFSGLAAAYELTLRGLRPVILEAEPDIGGLAATFELGGTRIERFYHHWFTNDRHVIELVSELGLARATSFIDVRARGCILQTRSTAYRRHSTYFAFRH